MDNLKDFIKKTGFVEALLLCGAAAIATFGTGGSATVFWSFMSFSLVTAFCLPALRELTSIPSGVGVGPRDNQHTQNMSAHVELFRQFVLKETTAMLISGASADNLVNRDDVVSKLTAVTVLAPVAMLVAYDAYQTRQQVQNNIRIIVGEETAPEAEVEQQEPEVAAFR